MATKTSLKAAPRARTGSGRLTQMRREGWIPSVIYGRGMENKNLKVDAKSFMELIARSASENIIVNLEIEGEGTSMAFIQAIQHNALTGLTVHADFLSIDDKTEITANIPTRLVGEAPGMKVGGVTEQYLHVLEIICLPNDLPEIIDIDISKLELGDSLHVGGVTYPKGVRPIQGDDVVIVHIGRAGSGADTEAAADEAAAPAAKA